jgi:hypothetical protein
MSDLHQLLHKAATAGSWCLQHSITLFPPARPIQLPSDALPECPQILAAIEWTPPPPRARAPTTVSIVHVLDRLDIVAQCDVRFLFPFPFYAMYVGIVSCSRGDADAIT